MAKLGTYMSSGGDDAAPLPVTVAPVVAPVVASAQAVGITAAAAVIADSGAMPAGVYRAEIILGFSGTLVAGKHVQVEHRNAANAATLQFYGLCPGGSSLPIEMERIVLAANERIRAVVGAVATLAGEVISATIRLYPLYA